MTTYRRIESVKTAISVLQHLSGQREPVSGPEIAAAMELPLGTVMCHLVTLEDAGLARCVGGAWSLGMGMGLLWARYKSQVEGKIARLNDELKQLEC